VDDSVARLILEVVAPDRVLFADEVNAVLLPGSEGEMTVLPGHAPVLTSLQAGLIIATDIQGKEQHLLVLGGFAEITTDRVIVLAERALHPDELTRERLEGEIRHLEAVRNATPSDVLRERAARGISRLEPIRDSLPIRRA
jgi:F-type H+-transporting ATPase subunit epsilon